MAQSTEVCPECGHEFQGNGWDGIDAHWRAKHAHLMGYEEASPLISSRKYKPKTKPREDPNQAGARVVRDATKR